MQSLATMYYNEMCALVEAVISKTQQSTTETITMQSSPAYYVPQR